MLTNLHAKQQPFAVDTALTHGSPCIDDNLGHIF